MGGNHGGHLAVIASLVGEVMSAEKAPITIEDTAEKKVLKIGDVGHQELAAVAGMDGGAVKVSNMPLAVGHHMTLVYSNLLRIRIQEMVKTFRNQEKLV